MLSIKGEQQIGNFVAGMAVKIAGRLIGKQQLRPAVKCAGERHPLLFAAGKLRRQMMETFPQPQLLQQSPGAATALVIGLTAKQRRKLDVFQSIKGWNQHK